MKCFYHRADLDGICSGAIVKYAFPDCEMIGYDHGDFYDFSTIKPGEVIYMVDISIAPELMRLLADRTRFFWIDHHITAIEANRDHAIVGLRDVQYSACELTWMHIMEVPARMIPLPIRLLGRYDVWDHAYSPDVLTFQYGMRSIKDLGPDHALWKNLFVDASPVVSIANKGASIIEYLTAVNAKESPELAYEADIGDMVALVMNRPFAGSKAFDTVVDWSRHHLVATWYVSAHGQYHYSLYTDRDDVDVSRIAVARGGGGHRKAAGFNSHERTF